MLCNVSFSDDISILIVDAKQRFVCLKKSNTGIVTGMRGVTTRRAVWGKYRTVHRSWPFPRVNGVHSVCVLACDDRLDDE